MSAFIGFFLGSQERVRNSRGKIAIVVRIIEVLLQTGRNILNPYGIFFNCRNVTVSKVNCILPTKCEASEIYNAFEVF